MSNPILNGKWRFHYDHNGAGVWVVELLDGPATHGQLVSVTRNDWQVSLMALSEQVPDVSGWWYVTDVDDDYVNDWQTAEYDWDGAIDMVES